MTAGIKKNGTPGTTTMVLLLLILTTATGFMRPGLPAQSSAGEKLYAQNCVRCHGDDGTRGFIGAKNLKRSQLTDSAIILQIKNGKGFMPSFKKKFTEDEIHQVVEYVKNLRK